MKYPVALLGLAKFGVSNLIIQDAEIASQVLSRHRRNNEGIFEEMRGNDLERECKEEVCSKEELNEAFGDDLAGADQWWNEATQYCNNNKQACNVAGTKTCVNLWMGRRCECKEGWEKTAAADDCSVDIDECATEGQCQNGGTCTNLDGGFTCTCQSGWTGTNCETDLDECDTENPCNGGVCTNSEGSYSCECTSAWTGETCQEDVNECSNGAATCENDSKCINLPGDYKCLCVGGYQGKTCGEDLDECSLNMCPTHTVCENNANGFVCKCPDRGCNNLDPLAFGEVQQTTHGYTSVDESEFSGDDSTTDEVVIDIGGDELNEVGGDYGVIVDPTGPTAVTDDVTVAEEEKVGTDASEVDAIDTDAPEVDTDGTDDSAGEDYTDEVYSNDDAAETASDPTEAPIEPLDYEVDTDQTADGN